MFTETDIAVILCRAATGKRVDRDENLITIEFHNGQVFEVTVREVTRQQSYPR